MTLLSRKHQETILLDMLVDYEFSVCHDEIGLHYVWVDLSMCAFLSPPTFEHCQSSLSNNALSGCSFSNRHCQTMPFQGVLSPIIIVKQWSFRMFFLILHFCPHLLLIWALSIIIVKQCPFRMFFLQPSLSNNALSGCSFSNHHCQTMPFQGVLSPIIIVKQCPLRISFLICVCPHLLLSIVNHHCQTMPSQDFLSHFAFLSPPSFENLSIVD